MVQIDWKFPRRILIAIVVLALLSAYPLWAFGSAEILRAVTAGALIATVNVLLGYCAIEYSLVKSTATFFKVVLGGMGIRMLLMAGALVILIKVYNYHVAALVGSLGIFYMVFLILEVLDINRKITIKQQL